MADRGAGTHLQAVVEAADRRDAAGMGNDGRLPEDALGLQQFHRPESHLGAQGGINAKVPVNLLGQHNCPPLPLSVPLKAGVENAADIIGIQVGRKGETLEHARAFRFFRAHFEILFERYNFVAVVFLYLL